jgi:hypothetical protein
MKTLNEAQKAALRKFALEHGRTWKAALRAVWQSSGDCCEVLRGLRNAAGFGPSGLDRLKLSDLEPVD